MWVSTRTPRLPITDWNTFERLTGRLSMLIVLGMPWNGSSGSGFGAIALNRKRNADSASSP